MKVFKVIGYILLGTLTLLTLFSLVFAGGVAGGYLYFSHSPERVLTLSIPGDGEEITFNISAPLSEEAREQLLEQGDFRGYFEFTGPFNLKLFGMEMSANIPIEELLETVVEQMEGD